MLISCIYVFEQKVLGPFISGTKHEFRQLNLSVIDDIRIPRWPWDERAPSHECEANAGKVAAKIQESYEKLWLVWRKRE